LPWKYCSGSAYIFSAKEARGECVSQRCSALSWYMSLGSFCGLRTVSLLVQVDTHPICDCCDLLLDAVSTLGHCWLSMMCGNYHGLMPNPLEYTPCRWAIVYMAQMHPLITPQLQA